MFANGNAVLASQRDQKVFNDYGIGYNERNVPKDGEKPPLCDGQMSRRSESLRRRVRAYS